MRLRGDTTFNNWLLDVGDGKIQHDIPELDSDLVELPNEIITDEDIIQEIFGNHIDVSTDDAIAALSRRVILSTKNQLVSEINHKILSMISGEEQVYHSIDSTVIDTKSEAIHYEVSFLNQQCPSGMPPHCLTLKVGAFVILLRNLDPKNGLLNGQNLARI